MALTGYPSTWEGEAVGSGVQGYPRLHRELQANLGYNETLAPEEIKVHTDVVFTQALCYILIYTSGLDVLDENNDGLC